jgi:hypothetical protein
MMGGAASACPSNAGAGAATDAAGGSVPAAAAPATSNLVLCPCALCDLKLQQALDVAHAHIAIAGLADVPGADLHAGFIQDLVECVTTHIPRSVPHQARQCRLNHRRAASHPARGSAPEPRPWRAGGRDGVPPDCGDDVCRRDRAGCCRSPVRRHDNLCSVVAAAALAGNGSVNGDTTVNFFYT